MDSTESTQGKVTSGIPQDSVLGLVLFNTFISDLDLHMKSRLAKLVDDTR